MAFAKSSCPLLVARDAVVLDEVERDEPVGIGGQEGVDSPRAVGSRYHGIADVQLAGHVGAVACPVLDRRTQHVAGGRLAAGASNDGDAHWVRFLAWLGCVFRLAGRGPTQGSPAWAHRSGRSVGNVTRRSNGVHRSIRSEPDRSRPQTQKPTGHSGRENGTSERTFWGLEIALGTATPRIERCRPAREPSVPGRTDHARLARLDPPDGFSPPIHDLPLRYPGLRGHLQKGVREPLLAATAERERNSMTKRRSRVPGRPAGGWPSRRGDPL